MTDLLFFLPDLRGGGAQRTVVNMLNHLDLGRFSPTLVVGCDKGPYLPLLRREVNIVNLGRGRVRECILPLAKEISSKKPHLVFSPYPDANVAVIMAKHICGFRGKTVLRESNNRSAQRTRWGFSTRMLVKWSYRNASKVVALSNGVRRDLLQRYGLIEDDVVTIYNPVDFDHIARMAAAPGKPPVGAERGSGSILVLGIGRLVYQKGFDLLIRAVAGLRNERIHLVILGEGEERRELLRLVDEMEAAEYVTLPGFTDNPYVWLRSADIFVLSSRWEGFGHVIVEAMACGVPVVSTRCPSGPDEIITDEIDGLLCEPEDVHALTERILYLAEHREERQRIARSAEASARRFDVARIVREYERLFEDVASA